jgi:hypothetical protein
LRSELFVDGEGVGDNGGVIGRREGTPYREGVRFAVYDEWRYA